MEDNITVVLENLELIHYTEKAYLVKNFEGTEAWIPKSQVQYIKFGEKEVIDGKGIKGILEMEIPQWLAEKNNLY